LPPGSSVSTLEHPVQDFQWNDFTAKPDHTYTYRVVALRGKPKKLIQTDTVEITVTTHSVDPGHHSVIFNRGVAGSQAYARRFGNRLTDEVGVEAFEWLSRGLVEGLLGYLGRAADARFGLRGALYEFQYMPVLKAFGAAVLGAPTCGSSSTANTTARSSRARRTGPPPRRPASATSLPHGRPPQLRQTFLENPIEVFKRNIHVSPFWEDDLPALAEMIGEDNVFFGSDYPHPEGLASPVSYVQELEGVLEDTVRKIMGGDLARLMGVGVSA